MTRRAVLMRTGGALQGALASSLLIKAPTRELAPGEIIGAFRIVREHSRGGMAIIYLAERADDAFSQRVALKWMQQNSKDLLAVRLFEREREFVASLSHPNIAHLLDGGREKDGAMWFAMEWIDGQTIDRYCTNHQCDPAQRINFVITLCDALGSAHARLLLHRDIKPDNVLVTEEGHIKLLDFGVAQMLGQDDPMIARSLTLAFASPEQIEGETLGVTSDIYQLGLLLCVLFEVTPELSTLSDTLLNSGSEAKPVQPTHSANWPTLPSDLRAIIRKAIAENAQQRYANTEALRSDLQRFLRRQSVSAQPDLWHYRLRCFARRNPWSSFLSVLAIGLMLLLTWQVRIERDLARQEAERARLEASRARASLDFVSELLNWSKPSAHKGRQVSVDEALKHAAEQLQIKLKDQPRTRGELLLLFADIYDLRGADAEGLALAEQAHSLLHADPQTEPLVRAHASIRLANLLGDETGRERSLAMAKAALDELVLVVAPAEMSSSDLLAKKAALSVSAHRVWAHRLLQKGDAKFAEDRARIGLKLAREALPASNEQGLGIEMLLATILKLRGEFAESLRIRRTLVPRLEQHLGEDHPLTGTARLGLVHDLAQFGDYQAAEAMAKTHLASVIRVWGDQHPEYARALFERAFIALEQGQFSQSRTDLQAGIRINLAFGADGMSLLGAQYERLAITEEQDGQLVAAEAALRLALSPAIVAAARTPTLGSGQLKLARVLMLQSQFEEVPTILERARHEMKSLSSKHARWAILHELTADLAQHQQKRDLALENYRAAIDQLQHAQTSSRDFDLKRNQGKLETLLSLKE
jgi:eukaryotic-like serine/threonine-protein kinase